MKTQSLSTLVALASGLQVAAATSWLTGSSFSCPSNTNNTCTPQQSTGFDWSGLGLGSFTTYADFNFQGYKCSSSFGKRDELAKRDFQAKCISGVATSDKGSSPSFNCGSSSAFSVTEIEVSVEADCDLQFQYDMPGGTTCQHTTGCSKGGSVVKNSQCGGATGVTVVYPSQTKPSAPKSTCSIGIHSIGFDCSTASTTIHKSTTIVKSSKSSSTPVYTTPASSIPATTSSTEGVVTSPSSSTVVLETPSSSSSSSICDVTPTSSTPAESVTETPSSSSTAETSAAVSSSSSSIISIPSSTEVESTPTPTTVEILTTVVIETTVTSCPVTSTITSAGTTSISTGTTVSTIFVSVTKTVCTRCTAQATSTPSSSSVVEVATSTPSSSAVVVEISSTPSSSSVGGEVTTSPVSSPTSVGGEVTTTTSTGPVVTVGCPEVLPKCMNTWMFTIGCADNTDSSCYCPSEEFVTNVFSCVSAYGVTTTEIYQAQVYFQGICAPYIPSNPAIVTCASSVVGATTVVATVPVTTVQIVSTITVPCTETTGVSSGFIIPSSSTVTVLSTAITVPQVVFYTTTAAGASNPAPVLITGAPASAVGAVATAIPAQTTISTVAVAKNSTATSTSPVVQVSSGASAQNVVMSGSAFAALVAAFFAL